MTLRQVVVGVALVAASSATAWSQPKTDVITLPNGDRITGEVKRLNRGQLELSTDDMGTIEIEWDKVISVEATRHFEVLLSNGGRVLGSLRRVTDRSVQVASDGEPPVTLAMSEVTQISPIGTGFFAKLAGSVDTGFNYTRSSGIAQTHLNAETTYRRPAFLFRLTTSATVTEQVDQETDDRASFAFSYVRYRGQRWFVGGGGRLETNESLGLELRTEGGGTLGWRAVNTNRGLVELDAGLVGNHEQGIGTEPTDNFEATLGARASFFTYDRPKTTIDGSIRYYPSLSDWGRQRLQVDASVRREVWKDFFVALTVFDTFDSDPPAIDASQNDVGVSASFGWSFD